MSATRINPFSDIEKAPQFDVKPPAPRVPAEQIDQLAREHNFPSREGQGTKPQRQRRKYITGRNQQFNIKATAQTIERFYKLADARKVPLGQLLQDALDALESVGAMK